MAPLCALLLGGCFPVLQTAEVRQGFHVDAGFVVLTDQERNGRAQGADLIPYVSPSFGLADDVEFGIPIGAYLEDGLGAGDALGSDDTEPVAMPYIKARVLERGPHRLLLATQTLLLVLPTSLGAIYGYDLGSWLPHVTVKRVFSWGPAGDDPFVTRYQEKDQSLWVFGGGARLAGEPEVAFELGVLLNSYEEGAVGGDFGQETTRRTLADLYLGGRIAFF